jgi:hypothetical protein
MAGRSSYLRDLHTLARAAGWTIALTRGNHIRLTHPKVAAPVFAASTPSDHRALANVRAELQRRDARQGEDGHR